MTYVTEYKLELISLDWLSFLDWKIIFGLDISPDGTAPEHDDYDRVVLIERLKTALVNIKPKIPPDAIDEASRKITRTESPSLIEINRRFHRMLTDGVDILKTRKLVRNSVVSILETTFSFHSDYHITQPTSSELRVPYAKELVGRPAYEK